MSLWHINNHTLDEHKDKEGRKEGRTRNVNTLSKADVNLALVVGRQIQISQGTYC